MTSAHGLRADFRNDINGLRAWAVAAVIVYHFGIPGLSGGFVGVDVFFVISGFLMTGILVRHLEQGRGAGAIIWDFYVARARRILPALIVLCAALLALGWWLLVPMNYRMLGSHVVAALAFFSNIKFWREAGYFANASNENWLLHTWSLAVEGQFYLLLPLVLLVVWKLRPTRLAIAIAISLGLLVSFALSVVLTPRMPSAAFYLLPTRAWELLAGGLVFFLGNRLAFTPRQRTLMETVGFGAVIAAIVGFDSSSEWPGWRAHVPVIGSVLVLLAAQSRSLWTGTAFAQWIGTRSYSIYLWHWPIVVALVYMERETEPIVIFAGLALTLILGHLSYRWIEYPTVMQQPAKRPPYRRLAAVCGTAAVVMSAGFIIWKDGVVGRFPQDIELAAAEAGNRNPRTEECQRKSVGDSPSCMYGGSRLRAILIGDSHADAVVTSVAVAAVAANPDDGVMQWHHAGCPTLFGALLNLHRAGPEVFKCAKYMDGVRQKLLGIPTSIPVIIVNRTTYYAVGFNEPWEKYANTNTPVVYFSKPYAAANTAFREEFAEHLVSTACQLAKVRAVFMVRPFPEMGVDVPRAIQAGIFAGQKEVSISLAQYHQRHAFVWAAQDIARQRCGVRILDPLPYLCADGRCRGGDRAGQPI